jgi:hypothetical protein
MKVIIAGGRDINEYQHVCDAMEAALLVLDPPTEVVSGQAPGVDTLGEQWAAERGIPVRPFPANWYPAPGRLDRAAGPKRNQRMAEYADALVAVWDGKSRGTADMIRQATARFGPTRVVVWRV